MNEQEFRARYAAAQACIKASPKLKRRAVENAVRAAAADEAAGARPDAPAAKRPSRRRIPAVSRTAGRAAGPTALARRWAIPVAACLAAGALVIAALPAVTSSLDQGGAGGTPMTKAMDAAGFSVRAYAADGSSILALGQDGTIVFDHDTGNGMHTGDLYRTEGFFTGCLFRVEGEGIARVQMNVSRGVLYSVITERFTRSEEPEKWNEALGWKATKRGTGAHFNEYDDVRPVSEDDGLPKDSPDKHVGVNLMKRLGATVDVAAADCPGLATGETSFGLWTNDPYPEGENPLNAVIDLFDGQTLTVTVTFDDGHASTQVIELHAASIKTVYENGKSKLVPEIVEEDGAFHSLYGTVIETNKEPFPLPLDNANELADTVMPALKLDGNAETRATDQTLGKDDLVGEGGSIDGVSFDKSDGTVPVTLGYPTLARSPLPPDGVLPGEFAEVVHASGGDLAYVDKCSREVFGYGFNEDGSLTSPEHSYVTATFDVTNESGDTVQLWYRSLAQYGILDEQGRLFIIETSYDLDFRASDNAVPADDPQAIGIAPGDTVQVTLLHVLPNRLLEADSLVFAPVNVTDGSVSQAFALGVSGGRFS